MSIPVDQFGFVVSDRFTNWQYHDIGGFDVRPWSEVVPATGWIVPSTCLDSDGVEYKPGEEMALYLSYEQVWIGPPSITYRWSMLNETDVALIRSGYFQALSTTRSRVWFMLYSGETQTWRVESGFIDPPTNEPEIGSMTPTFKLTFRNIGFHSHIASLGPGLGGLSAKPVMPTGLEFDPNGYLLA
jgi:hypothetical protein